MPPTPFDACKKQPSRTNSLSLVRFDDNDCSVPVNYAHHVILIKGYVDRVVLAHKEKVVAEHKRSWEKEGVFFHCLHYLPLLERKPGSLDHARPLLDLNLPECFEILRRRLIAEEARQGDGIREFIRVLRLLEEYLMARLTHKCHILEVNGESYWLRQIINVQGGVLHPNRIQTTNNSKIKERRYLTIKW